MSSRGMMMPYLYVDYGMKLFSIAEVLKRD
jgi:hypothetical protein